MTDTAPARSITKSVTIDRPAPDVHSYLADARTAPVVHRQRARHRGWRRSGWWQMTSTVRRRSSTLN